MFDHRYISMAVLEIVGACNLRCKHCYDYFEKSHKIDVEMWSKIINDLIAKGCQEITYSGGEPLLCPNEIFTLSTIAKSAGVRTVLTTNGILVQRADKELFKNFDMIQVSIDGPEEIHDSIRGAGNFKKSIEGIRYLKEHAKTADLHMMMTLSNMNVDHLDEVRKLSLELGVRLGVERLCSVGRADGNLFMDKTKYKAALEYAYKNKIALNDPLAVLLGDGDQSYACSAGAGALVIGSDFNCFMCTKLRVSVGNLKQDSWDTILHNIYYGYELGDPSKLKGKCGGCEFNTRCGGCRAAGFALTKDMFSEDPMCWHEPKNAY
jgi:radical SAM protein with 4Fe4S-binding SPASM domain